MQLTPQQLNEVLTGLRSSQPPASVLDRRRFNRTEIQTRVSVMILGTGAAVRSYTALTRDVSLGGIGLVQAMEAEQWSRLLVRLPRQGKTPMMLVCMVAHCTKIADGMYGVGAEFVLETDADAAQQFAMTAGAAAKHAPAPASDAAPAPANEAVITEKEPAVAEPATTAD